MSKNDAEKYSPKEFGYTIVDPEFSLQSPGKDGADQAREPAVEYGGTIADHRIAEQTPPIITATPALVDQEVGKRKMALVGASDASQLNDILLQGNRELVILMRRKPSHPFTSQEVARLSQLEQITAACEQLDAVSNLIKGDIASRAITDAVQIATDSRWPATWPLTMVGFADFEAFKAVPGSGKRYRLQTPLIWEIGAKKSNWRLIIAPETVFRISVPGFLEWALNPHDRRVLPAVVIYDSLTHQGFDLRFASAEFRRASIARGYPGWRAWVLSTVTLMRTAMCRALRRVMRRIGTACREAEKS